MITQICETKPHESEYGDHDDSSAVTKSSGSALIRANCGVRAFEHVCPAERAPC